MIDIVNLKFYKSYFVFLHHQF